MGYAQELSSDVLLANAMLALGCGCPSSHNVSMGRKAWVCPSHSSPHLVGPLSAAPLPGRPLGPTYLTRNRGSINNKHVKDQTASRQNPVA